MAGRRSSDKLTKLAQVGTMVVFLVFVLVVGFGLDKMFNEIKEITKGQQELILNLTAKSIQKNRKTASVEEVSDQYVSKISFIKYKNETNHKIKALEKKLNLLRQRVRAMKSPL
jgi:hypothetical protein